ncbi:hypothetical protein HK097_008279 [Rhizophlyctis rosea]|uniref:STI1/HOP DP domain-containing protein n=1 Tax=Rhizophlyctis rosea TaxID=64517 RepID=A0AAD5X7W1_9FUNG|nr:hypothetical protein HK097_008279 [Rhizophlyctis rosea]
MSMATHGIAETDNDLPPPLEDMSEEVQRRAAIRKNLNPPLKPSPLKPSPTPDPTTPTASKAAESQPTPKTFSGLKKGFFNSAPSTKTVAKRKPSAPSTTSQPWKPANPPVSKIKELPFIKPTQSKEDTLRIDEVQKAMQEGMSLLDKKEWLTPTLLHAISSSPRLQRAFSDPQFQQFASALSSPHAPKVLQQASKERPDLVEALKELAGLLGEEMDRLADRDVREKVREVEGDEGLDEGEKALVRRVLEDREVQDALKDPRIQKLMVEMQRNPPELHRMMATADNDMRKKIQKLLECGLLSIQR